MIKAVIFDMDGVMIDSEPLWEKTERELLARRDIQYTPTYREKILGLNQNDSGKLLKDTFSLPESVGELVDERLDILIGIYDKELELVKGLRRLLSDLGEKRLSLAVASSSPMRVIEYVLDRFSLHKYFEAVVSGECTENGKPHPDIYIHAAKELCVLPTECVAIEDSINGVRSAKAAGMKCIAIPDKRIDPGKFTAADHILNNLLSIKHHHIHNPI